MPSRKSATRKKTISIPVWLFNLLLAFTGAMLVAFWSVKRRQRPHLKEGGTRPLEPTLAGLLQTTVVAGNRIELTENGAFFDRLFDDIRRAEKSVNLESFLSKEGWVTRTLTDLLLEKQAAGVEVRVLLDGSGGREFGKGDIQRLSDAGCCVATYRPFKLRNLGRFNNRTHRKMAIMDGRIGYVGGHCLVDSWLGNAEDKEHFRDLSARIEGPIVTQLQSAFTDNWIEETGEVIGGATFFPEIEPAGESRAAVVFVSPLGGPSTLKLLHYFAIESARESITLQNPYFLPDPDARDALVRASRRGVRVRVMLPAASASDSPVVQHASHHHYGTLLRGGVRIFEYEKTLLHQKVFTIDGEWSSIGSTNFDDRSFEINDEISLVTFDRDIAQSLEAVFERDLEHATEQTLEKWLARPVRHKLLDFSTFLFNEQL